MIAVSCFNFDEVCNEKPGSLPDLEILWAAHRDERRVGAPEIPWVRQVVPLLQPGFPLAVPRVLSEEVRAATPPQQVPRAPVPIALLLRTMTCPTASAVLVLGMAEPFPRCGPPLKAALGCRRTPPEDGHSTQRTCSSRGGRRLGKPITRPTAISTPIPPKCYP